MNAPLSPASPAAPQDSFSFWNCIAIIRQRLHIAVGIFLLVVGATALYAWTRVPKYTATSRLLVESHGVNLTDMQDVMESGRISQRDLIQTQIQLITSTPVMKKILEKGFFNDVPAIIESRDPVAALAKNVHVTPARSGYVFDVSVTSHDPQRAADVVNAVVDAYFAENRSRRSGVSDQGIVELRRKSLDLRERLDAEAAALQAFIVSNRMVSFEDAQNIVVDRLQGLNKNLLSTEPRRIQAETQYRTAQKALDDGAPIESIPGVLESSIISNLKVELAKLEREYSDLQNTYGENHPQIKSILPRMDALRDQIAQEAARIVDGLRGRYEQSLNEESLIKAELAAQEQEVLRFNELAAQYRLLRQSRDSLQEAYNTIIRRIDELDVSKLSGQGDNVFIVSRAEKPSIPSWPNRKKLLAIGIFFGLLLGVGVCFLLDFLNTTIKGEADVQAFVGHPILGNIPSSEAEEKQGKTKGFYAVEHPRSHFAEAFRTIRTALAFAGTDHSVRSLVVSSTCPAEGKSLTTINLAIAYANANKRTLLIDADMRRPSLHKSFPDAPAIGLSDLLAGGSSLTPDRVISQTSIPSLSFLSAGTIPPNPVELLESARFSALLQSLSQAYDMIIFDAPPCINMVDALVLGKRTDGMVFVIRAFSTNKFAARKCSQQLALSGVRVLGTVLNDVDMPSGNYYYSSYYYYYDHDSDASGRRRHKHRHSSSRESRESDGNAESSGNADSEKA